MTISPMAVSQRLEDFETLFKEREHQVHAFVDEPNRFERLAHLAATNLLEDNPLSEKLLGVKDIFAVDGLPTKAGSQLPADLFASPQASSVTKLVQAGMLVAGKTVTTEFAYFTPGPTRNPQNLEHTPGGSSSGSAAAVAVGLVDIALGTQTIGSVIRPASFCGVVGFKPSYGRIPADGLIPLAPSLDHVGLFARNVDLITEAAGLLLEDPQVATPHEDPILAVPTGAYLEEADPEMLDHFWEVIARLGNHGYTILQLDPFSDFDEIEQRHQLVLAAEAARVHAEWFSQYSQLYSSKMAQLIKDGQAISDGTLEAARKEILDLRHSLMEQMMARNVAGWLSPSAPGAAPKGLESTGNPVMNLPWTQVGFPVVGLPSGTNAGGLPLGLQLVMPFGQDEQCLALASQLEPIVGASQ